MRAAAWFSKSESSFERIDRISVQLPPFDFTFHTTPYLGSYISLFRAASSPATEQLYSASAYILLSNTLSTGFFAFPIPGLDIDCLSPIEPPKSTFDLSLQSTKQQKTQYFDRLIDQAPLVLTVKDS